MPDPFPNMSIEFETKAFSIDITDIETTQISSFSRSKDVTNYEYEIQKNNEKRNILILKKEYLGAFIDDMRNIMKYDKSSQFIDNKTKKT